MGQLSAARHAGRRTAVAVAVAVAAVVVLLLSTGPVGAQTPPPPDPPAGGSALTSPCDPSAPPSTGPTDQASKDNEEAGACSSLMEKMVPGENPGPYPTSHYDIGYSGGGALAVPRKILGFLTDATFAGARWFTRTGLWIVQWALGFGFGERLAQPALAVANTYQTQVVNRLGLGPFFLFLAAAYGGYMVFRGRTGRGVGEFFVSCAIAAAAATMFASPGRLLLNGLDGTSKLSCELVAITTSQDPAALPSDTCEDSARPLAAQIHKAFIESPHELLNWGRVIPPGDPCRALYETIVQTGPWGSRSEPRDAMKATGCKAEATFNKDPSADRLMGAVLVLVATIFVMILLVLIAATLVGAQIGVVVAIAVSPFPMAAGALPGGGRQLLWRWLGGIGRALAGVVMTGVFLSLFLVGVGAVLTATSGEFLVVQMGVIDLLVVMALVARKRLLKAGRRAVNRAVSRVEQSRVGGSGRSGWLSPAAAGAVAGFGAGEAHELRQAHQQARGAVQTHRRRQAERSMIETRRAQAASARAAAGGRSAAAGTAGGAVAGVAAAATGGTAKTSAMRAQLQARMGQSSTGRVVLGATKVAVTGAKVAFASTVGAPVYAPRAAVAATNKAVQLKGRLAGAADQRVEQAGSFAREYGRNVAAPARWARNFVMADEMAAAKAAAAAGTGGASRRRRPQQDAKPGPQGPQRPRGWESWDRYRDWEGGRPSPGPARSGAPTATPSTSGPRRNPSRARPEAGRTGTPDQPGGAKRADLERRLAGARAGAETKGRPPRRQPR